MSPATSQKMLALCGGIGGAKLALGLYRVFGPQLAVIVNTGDDFEHLGLNISPDLDTVLYTLGGLADPERGWGRAGETWEFMTALRGLGEETWFQLGDRDLAMHVARTDWLRSGRTLSTFTARVAREFGIRATILPMSDGPLRTVVDTNEGSMPFQHYFVRRKSEPAVRAIRFDGTRDASPAPGLLDLFSDVNLQAIVLCPSNPYLSIDPILAVPGIAAALMTARAPVIAVSPLIGGRAIKGPTAKIMMELGCEVTNASITSHYRGLIDALVIDETDASDRERLDIAALVTRTFMGDLVDRERLARDICLFAQQTASQSRRPMRAGGAR